MTATTLDRIYLLPDYAEETVVPRFVPPPAINPYAPAYVIPAPVVSESPDTTRKLQDLIQWSGLSKRVLGQIAGVSHPTIGQALSGNIGALSRRNDAVRRLDAAHDVVERIFILARRDKVRVAALLEAADSNDVTAIEHLVAGNVTDAYLAAIRTLRQPRSGGMMTSRYPMDPRRAAAAVYDED